MIQRTFDLDYIQTVLQHPDVKPWISDDNSEDLTDYSMLQNRAFYCLKPMYNSSGVGLFVLYPVNSVTYEIHTAILPEYRGAVANQAAKDLLQWVVKHTDIMKLVTYVPSFNTAALRYAKTAGLTVEGCNRESFLKNGQMYDQTLLGITRKEICH